jgi:hypothetical protein
VRVLVYHGADVVKKYKTFKNYDIVLTTFDTLKNQHRVLAEKRDLERRKELYEAAMLELQEEREKVEARRPQAVTPGLLASVDADLEIIEERMKEEKRLLKHGPNPKKKGKPGRPSVRPLPPLRAHRTDSPRRAEEGQEERQGQGPCVRHGQRLWQQRGGRLQ